MPTNALDSILYREVSKVSAREVISIASPLLQELVNYGTNALARAATTRNRKVDEDLAILVLYRHIIELTDGIEVLVSESCPVPAIPLVRSSFEALLAMEYILENHQEYEQRSLSWLVGYIHKRLDLYDRLDPSTQKGQEFKRDFDNDKTVSNIPLPPVADVQKARTNLQNMLSKSHIQPIEAEFSRHRGTPNWYRLFGGPSNLENLARHLKRGGQYAILYRSWSTSAHAQDASSFIDRTNDGESAIRRIREPEQIRETTSFAATSLVASTRLILGKLRPGEDLKPWYIREVRERFLTISRGIIRSEDTLI